MWRRWLPWKYLVSKVARAQGFLDPIKFLSQLQRFAQPSEVAAPVELLRLSMVLQARGILNAQAIQHNLDWIWPYWVRKQFDPRDPSFIPRAFSVTHINLSHRNWTAVGLPVCDEYPIVDPRGLVTPVYDEWSIDAWILPPEGRLMVPSELESARQRLIVHGQLAVETEAEDRGLRLESSVDMIEEGGERSCRIQYKAKAPEGSLLAVSIRPYNPEGVTFVHEIEILKNDNGWKVEGDLSVFVSEAWDSHGFASYHQGDVAHRLRQPDTRRRVECRVGMATAAGLWKIGNQNLRELTVLIPLKKHVEAVSFRTDALPEARMWEEALSPAARLSLPDEELSYLYAASLRSLVLHTGINVFPGPYTYRHFWFRDAVFILHALLNAGLTGRAEKIMDLFAERQRVTGYFCSQDGEWDSNGQVLWAFQRYRETAGKPLKESWWHAVEKGAKWIVRKRLSSQLKKPHAGLLPAGFSAEHLGPNDFYFWDDFWAIGGLRAAAALARERGKEDAAQAWAAEAENLNASVLSAIAFANRDTESMAIPASPYRRMDTAAIGSLVGDYPCAFREPADPAIMATVRYLKENCFVEGGFFHDMSHSGINPYLTLHIAQVLLRAGDPEFFTVIKDLAGIASGTGQWPEAVNPRSRGGCMGDGQHVWASAEWVSLIRNLFLREEGERLVLFSGIIREWLEAPGEISFGPAPTKFGMVRVSLVWEGERRKAVWEAEWRGAAPPVEIRLPGRTPLRPASGTDSIILEAPGDKQ